MHFKKLDLDAQIWQQIIILVVSMVNLCRQFSTALLD